MKMVWVLALAGLVGLTGCESTPSNPVDAATLIDACAKGCNIGSRMLKWNAKEGCVCDTTPHPKDKGTQ